MPVLRPVLSPVELLVRAVLEHCHDLVVHLGAAPGGGAAWALAVALLVVAVRVALLPLAVQQVRVARRTRALAPELRRLVERHRGTDAASRAAHAREVAALQAAAGAGPLAGCLPVLAQAPVLLAVFWVVSDLGTSGGAVLLGAGLDSGAGALLTAAATAGVGAAALLVLGLLAVSVAAQTGTALLARRTTPVPAPPAQQRLVLLLPPVVLLLSLPHVSLGVLVYWTSTSLWSLLQQLVTTWVLTR